ncbi:MAG: EamA family transporter [Oscillospiraceae bacterium]|nr:EamA family transporter [Oscillospiraceae bacterium]
MKKQGLLPFVSAMVLFGTLGLFVRYLPFASSFTAMVRGLLGAGFLSLVLFFRQKPNLSAIGKDLLPLVVSGVMIGFNWICLFEAYRYTTVATATLCYYFAPVLVLLLSPLFLKEKLSKKNAICILVALLGMIPVSGVFSHGVGHKDMTGVAFGLAAAGMYAGVVLTNKTFRHVSATDRTVVQLFVAGLCLVPYVLLTKALPTETPTALQVVVLLTVALLHTGVAYLMYFGGLARLSAQKAALLSYLDPAVAVLLSAVVLGETFTWQTALGAVMILGATIVSELQPRKGSAV